MPGLSGRVAKVSRYIDEFKAAVKTGATKSPDPLRPGAFIVDATGAASPRKITAGEAFNFRKGLDDIIYGESLPSPDQVDKQFVSIRGIMKNALNNTVFEQEGEVALEKLKKLNTDYQVLAILDKSDAKNVGRVMSNRANSLTDYVSAAGLAPAGAVFGGAVAGPLGAGIGAGAGKLVGMFGNQYLRRNYNRLAAQGAEKLGILFTEQSMRHLDGELARIPETLGAIGDKTGLTRTALTTAPSRALEVLFGATGTRAEQFAHASELLAHAQGELERHADIAGGLADSGAPMVGEMYADKAANALAYLRETLPRPRSGPQLFGPKDPYAPTSREMSEWERRVEVVSDPLSVFSHLRGGTLTAEHVEALRRVYPAIAQRLANAVNEYAAKPDAPVLPAQVRQRLGNLLGNVGGNPSSVAMYQASFSSQEKGSKMGRGGGSPAPPQMTDVQRITAR
jgi:hypothetical protein